MVPGMTRESNVPTSAVFIVALTLFAVESSIACTDATHVFVESGPPAEVESMTQG